MPDIGDANLDDAVATLCCHRVDGQQIYAVERVTVWNVSRLIRTVNFNAVRAVLYDAVGFLGRC